MTAKKPRIIPAVARLDKLRKPTRIQRLAQQRQAAAWQQASRNQWARREQPPTGRITMSGASHPHHPEQRELHGRCPRCRRNPTKRGQLCPTCQPPPTTMNKETPMKDDLLIAVSLVALELDEPAKDLTARLGDDVLLDDLHRPAIERPLARKLISEHHTTVAAAAAAKRERDERFQAHMAELSRRNRPRSGVPARPGSTALADLMAGDPQWS